MMPKSESDSPSICRKTSRAKKIVNHSFVDYLTAEDFDDSESGLKKGRRKDDSDIDSEEESRAKKPRRTSGRRPKYSLPQSPTLFAPKIKPETGQEACLLCQKTVSDNRDAKFHYSVHFYEENIFLKLLKPEDLVNGKAQDETGKVYKYQCPHDGCTKRKMGYKEMCVHLAIAHQQLRQLLKADERPGMKEVLNRLFPEEPTFPSSNIDPDEMDAPMGGKSLTASVNKKSVDRSDDDTDGSDDDTDGSDDDTDGSDDDTDGSDDDTDGSDDDTDGSDDDTDGSDDDIEVMQSVINRSGVKFGNNMRQPAEGSLLKTKQNEDQGFEILKEAPGTMGGAPRMGNPFGTQNLFNNPNLSSLAALMAGGNMGNMSNLLGAPRSINQSSMLQKALENGSGSGSQMNPFAMLGGMSGLMGLGGMQGISWRSSWGGPPSLAPRVDKPHNCLVCNALGRTSKDGRNHNLGSGLQKLKYHYSVCVYNEGDLVDFVDHGQGGVKYDEALELYGKKFRYKCPFVNCTKNQGRNKAIGYKEYAIHCAVAHHQIERWMVLDDRPGLKEVYQAVKAAREEDGLELEYMPDVVVVHTCLICGGDDEEGMNLSFDGLKFYQTRYHYAACYYEEGAYKTRYPPGPTNTKEDGEPKDILGKEVKYSCEDSGCIRKMGYKEFSIHRGIEHGDLEEIMREDHREQIRALADRFQM